MIDPNKFAYYGDSVRWFVATVVNNNDPQRAGRVQIRIYGVHSPYEEDVSNGDLPWAQTLLPTTEGGTSGIGRIPQLLPNALVFGIFLDGSTSQLPLVIGHMNKNEVPSPLQRATYPMGLTSEPFASGRVVGPNGVVVDQSVIAANSGNVTEKRMAAMKFFVDQFKKPEIAAGICGNLQQESGFSNTVVNSIGATGLAQWLPGPRLDGLKRFATLINKDWNLFDTQLQYIMHELQGGQCAVGAPHNCYNQLAACTTYEGGNTSASATWVFLTKFEIPGNHLSEVVTREAFARQAYREFVGQ